MLKNLNFNGLFSKLVLPVVALFTITIIVLGLYIPGQIEKRAVEGATAASEQTAKQFKVLRKYYVQNILKKVKAGSDMRPQIDHKNDPKAFPLPATMIHDLSALLKNEGTTVNLYSAYSFPNRQSRVLDKYRQMPGIIWLKNRKRFMYRKLRRMAGQLFGWPWPIRWLPRAV